MSLQGPPSAVLQYCRPAITQFLRLLLPALRGNISLSSFYRSPASNRAAAGHSDSQHLLALAVDITGPPGTIRTVADACREAGLVAVEERTHLHVQLFPAGHIRASGYGWLFDLV